MISIWQRDMGYLWNKSFLKILLIINIIGSLYGYYWYRGQLLSTDVLFLIFVPDSPLSTTLFSLVIYCKIKEKTLKILPLLSSAFLAKYGLWAVLINFHLLFIGESFTWINLMLALSHLGMAVEGVIYYPYRSVTLTETCSVSAVLIFWDFMDYAIGLHPYLFSILQYDFALHAALILTGLIIGFLWYHFILSGTKLIKI